MKLRTICVATSVLVMSSCAAGASNLAAEVAASSRPLDIGQVGADCAAGEYMPMSEYYSLVDTVSSLTTDELSSIAREADDAAMVDISAIRTAPSFRVVAGRPLGTKPSQLGPQDAGDARRLPDGHEVLLATQAADDADIVRLAAVVLNDGELTFAGNCGRAFTDHLRRYRDIAIPESSLSDVFAAVTTADSAWADFNDWDMQAGRYAPPAFEDLAPRDRILDVELTPRDVVTSLTSFTLDLSVPEAWLDIRGAALCTFAPEGWNECTALEALDPGSLTARLYGFANGGDTLEVWLVDYLNGGVADPIALVGEFRLESSDGSVVARVVGASGRSFEDARNSTMRVEVTGP